jgi:predicted RNase H-like HicB family nuclease
MRFQIEVEREEDGRWIAEVPDLPGVMVYGPDRATAVAKAEALASRVVTERLDQLYASEVSGLDPDLHDAQRRALGSEDC